MRPSMKAAAGTARVQSNCDGNCTGNVGDASAITLTRSVVGCDPDGNIISLVRLNLAHIIDDPRPTGAIINRGRPTTYGQLRRVARAGCLQALGLGKVIALPCCVAMVATSSSFTSPRPRCRLRAARSR